MIISLHFNHEQLELMDIALVEERFSELLRSHKYGNNLLVVSRACSKWALERLTLIKSDRSVLERLAQEIAQTGGLVSRAERAIVVGSPGSLLRRLDSRLVNVPIDCPQFGEIIKCPVLIVEDIVTDKEVYHFLLEKLPGIPLPFTTPSEAAAHGGGERIEHVARERVAEGRIVYALADSDRRWPKAESSKGRGLSALASSTDWPLFFFGITPGLEIENIFGIDVLRMISAVAGSGTFACLIAIDRMEAKASVSAHERHSLFFDLKKGLPGTRLEAMTDEAAKKWMLSRMALAGFRTGSIDVPGFGEKLASEIMKDPACKAQMVKTMRDKDWLEVFGRFLAEVRWVFAAAPRHRT